MQSTSYGTHGGPVAKTATCIIADDHSVVREGLRARLARTNVRVVGEASTGAEAITLIDEVVPDLALVDLRMPESDGIDVAQHVHDRRLATRVIIFSALTDSLLVERAFGSGASGYVGKETSPEIFRRAIDFVLGGRTFVDPTVAADMIVSGANRLSDRERQILMLAAGGSSNTAIAQSLGIAGETVKSHMSSILTKLGAESRTEAVAIALRRAIID